MAPTLTVESVKKLFAPLAKPDTASQFAENIHDDVHWTIAGPYTTPRPFGEYNSKKDFLSTALGPGGLALVVEHEPIVSGDRALVELRAADANGKTPLGKNGTEFESRYAWVIKVNEDLKIVEARAYLNTHLVRTLLDRL